MNGPRHIISADRFTPELVGYFFDRADHFAKNPGRAAEPDGPFKGRVLYRLFYEASTRTYESFGFAALRLGLDVLGTQAVEFSSVSKGETLADTIRTICQYGPAAIVLRSREAGLAAAAAAVSTAPIINAGDGKGEHPTQALLDLYTVDRELGRVRDLKVVIGGDLAHGRTVRSLTKLLLKYPGNSFTFVSPPELAIPADLRAELAAAGAPTRETAAAGLDEALRSADVVYWTRTQKERLSAETRHSLDRPAAAAGGGNGYRLGRREVELMPAHARLLHPLPRVDEISPEVDADPRAAYFRQMRYGMLVRMAVIEWVLGRD